MAINLTNSSVSPIDLLNSTNVANTNLQRNNSSKTQIQSSETFDSHLKEAGQSKIKQPKLEQSKIGSNKALELKAEENRIAKEEEIKSEKIIDAISAVIMNDCLVDSLDMDDPQVKIYFKEILNSDARNNLKLKTSERR